MKGVILLTNLPSMEVAKNIAHGLVENRFAACVSIVPSIRSVYSWKGEIYDEEEFMLLIKTREEKYKQAEAFIKKHHPYELPEIISLKISDALKDYMKWIFDETDSK